MKTTLLAFALTAVAAQPVPNDTCGPHQSCEPSAFSNTCTYCPLGTAQAMPVNQFGFHDTIYSSGSYIPKDQYCDDSDAKAGQCKQHDDSCETPASCTSCDANVYRLGDPDKTPDYQDIVCWTADEYHKYAGLAVEQNATTV